MSTLQTANALPVLNAAAALELVDGDRELYNMLLDAFMQTPFDRAKLETYIKTDRAEAARYVHAPKGAGRQIGLERLAAMGQALEDVLRGKTDGDTAALTDAFVRAYDEAVAAVKAFN